MIFRFSGILLRMVDYDRELRVNAPTLGDGLALAEERYPMLKQVLRDADGEVRRAHRVVVNGEPLARARLSTPVGDADSVEFLTAIAGG